jgi:hypothetical protein
VEIPKLIDDLRASLKHITGEEELLRFIADGLAALRQLFPSHRSLFAPSDIEFLKSLTVISGQLRAFIEIKEELLNVGSLEEYREIVSRLIHVKDALAGLPVTKRVAKEIRELNERLPTIRDQDEANRKFRLTARIVDLERNPCHCSRNHPMVIRGGRHGYFWGCSRYPFCEETAPLTAEQNDLLMSSRR